MENKINNWYVLSDPAILQQIGIFIQGTRVERNTTQQELAERAGIDRSTLVRLENEGRGSLLTFVQVLRALDQLYLLQAFELKSQISPLQLAKAEMQKRKRARSKKEDVDQSKSSW